MYPGAAAGTGWTNPNNSLAEDGACAIFPAFTAVAQYLKLTDFDNNIIDPTDEVVGVEAEIVAQGTGGPFDPIVKGSKLLYLANASQCTESADEACDLDSGTYYGHGLGPETVTKEITVVIDMGSPVTVDHAYTMGFQRSASALRSWHYSNDGTSWTSVPFASSPPAHTRDVVWTFEEDLTSPVTARYWRYSSRDTLGVDDGVGPRCYEFRLYNDGLQLAPRPSGEEERLVCYLTLDGSTPVGDPRVATIPASGDTIAIGGPLDTWGLVLSPSDIGLSTFGIVMVRGDVLGSEALSTDRRVDAVRLIVSHNPSGGSLMPRETPLQFCIVGKEVTPGTGVSPNTRLKASKFNLEPQETSEEKRAQGDLLPVQEVSITDWAQGSLSGYPTYDEIGILLASIVGKPVTSNPATGVYRHEFFFDSRGQADFQAYTNEYGDANVAERFVYSVLSQLGIQLKRQEAPSLDGTVFARKMTVTTLTAGSNGVQTLTITGTPTGGTYKLRFKGAMTSALNHNANSAAIQAALEALSTIGSGNVAVSGTGPFTVTFQGALAGKSEPIIELADNALSGGTSPTVTIAITTVGGYTEFDCVPVEPGHVSVFYATTQAGLGAGKLADCFESSWQFGPRLTPVWVLDDALDSFKTATEDEPTMVVNILVQADSVASTMVTDRRDRTTKWLRIAATSKVNIPTTSTPFSLTLEMPCQIRQTGTIEDNNQIVARRFEASARFDNSIGKAFSVVLVNGKSTY